MVRAPAKAARPLTFQAPDLTLEVAVREPSGPLVTGRHPRRWVLHALRLPGLALLAVVVVLPILMTTGMAFWEDRFVAPYDFFAFGEATWTGYFRSLGWVFLVSLPVYGVGFGLAWKWPRLRRLEKALPVAWVGLAAFLALPGVGLSNFAVLDSAGWASYGRTLIWVAAAAVLLVLGLVIAQLSRQVRWLWLPLALPFGVSALVAGVAFRLIFDPAPERGVLAWLVEVSGLAWLLEFLGVDAVRLYQGSMWFLLLSAFAWTWLGFTVSLFRASLDAIDGDPAKRHYLAAGTDRSKVMRLVTLVGPVALLVGLTIGVAAARVFDLVLIAVPGSMQYGVDPAGVHWWRLNTSGRDAGEIAAYALPLALLVCLAAWALQLGLKHHRHGTGRPVQPRPPNLETGRQRQSRPLAFAAGVVTFLWLVPVAVLVATALHDPAPAGAKAWLSFDGFGLESILQVWNNAELGRSLSTTLWVAGGATALTVAAAAPLAYLLASRPTHTRTSRVMVALFVVLSVMPVQMYIAPLNDFSTEHGLSGTRVPLILVHVAAGLPFAVLALRAALLAPKDSPAGDALYGLTSPMTTLRRIWERAGSALVAVAVLEFVLVWNDFIVSFLIGGSGGPLSLLLWGEARQFAYSSGTVAAGAAIWAVIPVTLLLATWRRYVVPGLTGGVLR